MKDEIEKIFSIVQDGDYLEAWFSLRVTFDWFITEENEVEFMDNICELHQKFVNDRLGEIISRNVGIENMSGHNACEKWTDPYTKATHERTLYAGDKCNRHGHIHYRLKLKDSIAHKVNTREEGTTPTSSICNVNKKFWELVKKDKLIDPLWFSMNNTKHQRLDVELKDNDPNCFLGYPLKMFHRRPPEYEIFCKKWTTWDDDTFRIQSLARQSVFNRDIIAGKKKKDLLEETSRSSWSEKVETWIKKRTNDYSVENIDSLVLDYYLSVGIKHDCLMIVKDRNLFLNLYGQEYRKQFLTKCSNMK